MDSEYSWLPFIIPAEVFLKLALRWMTAVDCCTMTEFSSRVVVSYALLLLPLLAIEVSNALSLQKKIITMLYPPLIYIYDMLYMHVTSNTKGVVWALTLSEGEAWVMNDHSLIVLWRWSQWNTNACELWAFALPHSELRTPFYSAWRLDGLVPKQQCKYSFHVTALFDLLDCLYVTRSAKKKHIHKFSNSCWSNISSYEPSVLTGIVQLHMPKILGVTSLQINNRKIEMHSKYRKNYSCS